MKADPWIEYYVHDGARILRTGHCPRSLLVRQAHKGQVAVEGFANDRNEKIVNGVKVAKTRQEIAATQDPIGEIIPGENIVIIKQKEWDDLIRRIEKLETK